MIGGMIRVLALFVLLMAAPALAELRPQGLMWNRTGLPAIFPFQLRSDPGEDYYIVLTRADTGAPALAAYASGGAVFRVLVPPGDYRVSIAVGVGWRGETALFGPKTRHIRLETPLHFGAEGRARRVGNLIDLRRETLGAGGGRISTVGLCRGADAPEVVATGLKRGVVPPPPKTPPVPAAPNTRADILAEPRRPEAVLPPPDQPPRALDAPDPFAAPFATPNKTPIPLPKVATGGASVPGAGPGAGQVPKFASNRPRAPSKGIRAPRWKICD